MDMVQIGAHLFQQRNCVACHSIDGTVKKDRGPTLKGVFGHGIKLSDGHEVTADENYLRDSIVNPMKEIVAGFAPIMPTYKGQLTEDDINALVAYIKSLKE